jgi:endonuclease/exonuclease/phosphatase family metal-dependent hydrolase
MLVYPILFFFQSFLSPNYLQGEITVISYNIRYDNPEDGPNNWSLRKERIVSYLQQTAPDIVGMQEVLHHQLLYLKSTLEEFSYIGVGRDDGKTLGEYSPIFYNTQNLKLKESSTFWLSQTPDKISIGWDAALERICTYARFEQRQTGEQFWVFNTHFDHMGTIARAESVKLILKKIDSLNTQKIPVLITGDFNLTPDTTPIKRLQNVFDDVMKSLSSSAKNHGTFTGFNKEETGTRRIDYIFSKDLQLETADHIWVKTERGEWASDHHPVQASFIFKN